MIVSIVHDDTDIVKLQIKKLRDNLIHVEPRVTFKSCCVWDFTDLTFDDTSSVLLILSKRSVAFRKVFFDSLVKHSNSDKSKKCRACLVFEAEENTIEEEFESVVGKDRLAVVDNLDDTFKWLPKVCVFLFKKKGHKNNRLCVIPEVEVDSKPAMLRKILVQSLRDMNVNISEKFRNASTRCCVLLRTTGDGDLARDVKDSINTIRRNGGTILEFSLFPCHKPASIFPGDMTYGDDRQALFVIHILLLLDMIDIKTLLGKAMIELRFEYFLEDAENLSLDSKSLATVRSGSFANVICSGLKYCGKGIGLILLAVLFSNALVFFLTPFPCIAMCVGGKELFMKCFRYWIYFSGIALMGALSYVGVMFDIGWLGIVGVFAVPILLTIQINLVNLVKNK